MTTECNTYSAKYYVDGISLAISGLTSGQTHCSDPGGIMGQESAFLADLSSAGSFKWEGSTLTILNSNGQAVILAAAQ